jgi:uncharacterized membrane protein
LHPPRKDRHLAAQRPLLSPRVSFLAFALFLSGAICLAGEFYIVSEFLVLFGFFAVLFALSTGFLLLLLCIHEVIRRSYRLIHEATVSARWHTRSVKHTLAP